MKKLFIYYSMTGNGDIIASKMKELGYDIRKVVPKRGLPKNFFLGMMVGGMLSGMNHKAKLVDFNSDVSDYEEIVIGSPIWNANLACPMNTVMSKLDLLNKKVTFILYSGSGSASKTVAKLNKMNYYNVLEIQEPKKHLDKIDELLALL